MKIICAKIKFYQVIYDLKQFDIAEILCCELTLIEILWKYDVTKKCFTELDLIYYL